MSYDPFVIIGVDHDASQQEILEAYKMKRSELAEKRFLPGEEGADAAKQLSLLDEAYQRAMEIRDSEDIIEDNYENYDDVIDAIKNHDLERAQRFLDNKSYRGAEWHYQQARVYFEKKWYLESKSQLAMAMDLDPSNAKYKKVYEKVNEIAEGKTPNAQQNQQQRSYTETSQNNYGRSYGRETSNRDAGDTICSVCATLWCADMCCECMGGDLIRCC